MRAASVQKKKKKKAALILNKAIWQTQQDLSV